MVVSSTTMSCANAITINARVRLRDFSPPRLPGRSARSAGWGGVLKEVAIFSFSFWNSCARRQRRACCGCRPAGRCLPHAQVLVDADEAELQQLVTGESGCGGGVVDDLWLNQGVVVALVGDHAPTRRLDVQVPRGVLAERARHHERSAQRPHAEGRGIHPPGLASAVMDDAD